MRLLAVRGENLTSLAEPFEIRFDAPPLSTAGLFAITGPTGAGKSTILDAVCLALFNKLPRLGATENLGEIGDPDAPAERRLRDADVRAVLRHGAGEGFAEVEFAGRDGRAYTARWEVWRARRRAAGALQTETIMLTDLESGARIGDKKTDTLIEIRDRLGLTFDQFRRAALLAQGDFDAFLTARSTERAELLERITGAEIYARISQAAYERHRAEEAEIDRLRTQLGEHRPLDPQARETAETALAGAETRFTEARATDARIRTALDWRRRFESLAAQRADLTARRDAAAGDLGHNARAAQRAAAAARRGLVLGRPALVEAGVAAHVVLDRGLHRAVQAVEDREHLLVDPLAEQLRDHVGVGLLVVDHEALGRDRDLHVDAGALGRGRELGRHRSVDLGSRDRISSLDPELGLELAGGLLVARLVRDHHV